MLEIICYQPMIINKRISFIYNMHKNAIIIYIFQDFLNELYAILYATRSMPARRFCTLGCLIS